MTSALAQLGGLDVLVNNAGIGGATAPLEELDPQKWQQVLDINLTGTFNVTRLAIPHLRHSSSGVIINMSSLAGRLKQTAAKSGISSIAELAGQIEVLAGEEPDVARGQGGTSRDY